MIWTCFAATRSKINNPINKSSAVSPVYRMNHSSSVGFDIHTFISLSVGSLAALPQIIQTNPDFLEKNKNYLNDNI